MQADYARFQQNCPQQLTVDEREQIRALATHLPELWRASTTTPQDRQAIARLLLEQVIVTVDGITDRVEVELRWSGGFVSHHRLLRPVQTYEQLSNYDELMSRIQSLRVEGYTLGEIAKQLNEEGFRPPKRSPTFNVGILSVLQRNRRIRTGPLPRSVTQENHLLPNEWWFSDLAARLGMPIATMHRWRIVGWVSSRKVTAVAGRWAIYADDEELERMTKLRNTPRSWPIPYPAELITPKKPKH